MSNTQQLSAAPMDPHQWRESVLSTRSLSYLSTYEALGASGPSNSRNLPRGWPQERVTMRPRSHEQVDGETEAEHVEVDMLGKLNELPESVAASLLFRLPRELRNRIYGLCLTAQTGLATVEWMTASSYPKVSAALLRTCHIVHDEAAPLLYTLNNLTFHNPSDANMFARALSPHYRHCFVRVSLHIKWQDTKLLWMTYLTSTDQHRSLKADFPNLRFLNIRYRSGKWNHHAPPDINMEFWDQDPRQNEMIAGLRATFLPPPPKPSEVDGDEDAQQKPLNEMTEREFMAFVDRHRPGEDMAFKRQLLELHKAHVPPHITREPPVIKVIFACRVIPAAFNFLTGSAPDAQPIPPPPNGAVDPPAMDVVSPIPVVEGEPFRGFSAVDLRMQPSEKYLRDPALGSANVARTPFADKQGILVALELHCLDPRREALYV